MSADTHVPVGSTPNELLRTISPILNVFPSVGHASFGLSSPDRRLDIEVGAAFLAEDLDRPLASARVVLFEAARSGRD